LIHASLSESGRILYSADENILIKSDGNYVLDLILLPLLDEELDLTQLDDPGLDFDFSEKELEKNGLASNYLMPAFIVLVLALLAAFILYRKRGLKPKSQPAKTEEKKPEAKEEKAESQAIKALLGLDEDEKKVIEVIKNYGNRCTQLDLRKKLDVLGEAKISLILTELEHKGFVKKIKKGRGNIIILSKELR
jgi:uncharacterized membrane protein